MQQFILDHPRGALTTLAVLAILVFGWWVFAGRKWYRKVRRRRGGVYLWRTDRHHVRPEWFMRWFGWIPWIGHRENAYVGESVSFYLRERDHLGKGRHKHAAKDWSDLRPVMHRVIKLPWWLCWKWVLRPLETLVMLVTWPRYNVAKNGWNPRRITPARAEAQRAERDRRRAAWGVFRSVNYSGREMNR